MTGLDTLAERWERAREALKNEGLGPVVVCASGVLGRYGLANYLTGSFPDPKGTYVVFGSEAPPVIVARSPDERLRWELYGNALVETTYPTGSSHLAVLERVAELIDAQQDCRPPAAAAAGGRGLPWKDHQRLTELLGVANLPDVYPLLNQIKRFKTPSDLQGMGSAIRMAEEALDRFVAQAYAGMTELEAAAMIEAMLPTCLVYVSAGPYLSQAPTERSLDQGDVVTVFVEVANADGYWVELGALVAFGRVAGDRWTLAEKIVDTLRQAERHIVAGSRASGLACELDRLVKATGHPAFGYGHGVGIDEEPPVISRGDHTPLEAGTTITLHPSILKGDMSLAVANTYSLHEHGAVPLSSHPYRIYRIP
ncbi:MAG: aminopeptidase P family protein [Acidimicrobiia bacterium]|nr:aminopeptidase P family protein [Acidimicrobiia bacterium]